MKSPEPLRTWRSSHRLSRWMLAFAAVLALLVFLVVRSLSPLPPRTLSMSTGVEDGAYHLFGRRYQELLRANGVRLELTPSSGSIENLERLLAHTVSVAFVQGGVAPPPAEGEGEAEPPPLHTLATVAYEPVWIFTHTLDVSHGLQVLAGKRIAAGVPRSGNQKVALDLLRAYGVGVGGTGDDAAPASDGTRYDGDTGLNAAEKLRRHEVDAVILVAAPEAAAVRLLLADPAIRLASLDHVEGLARRYPYLQPVSLKRGSIDPAHDRPSRDIALLATTANLVTRDDLHPALAYLLLDAAKQVHHTAGLLSQPGDFPSPRGTDFPLSSAAERYFRNGRPFLQNYLPFWIANYVQRLLLVLVPLLAILFPLARVLPELLAWRRHSRLYRRYGELKFLEQDIASRTLDEEARRAALAQLDRIEHDIVQMRFPLELADRVYTLRQHIDFVRGKLVRGEALP